MFKNLNHRMFWPAILLLLGIVVLNFANIDMFTAVVNGVNDWILDYFGGTFSLVGLTAVIMCIIIYFSPFGNVVIGGKNAKPMMSKWNWFAITLCTTIATGCVFWGFVQPVVHIVQPPVSMGLEPGSPQSAVFALSTIFMQWSFHPYALYCLPGLMFAFVYYNMKKPYGITSTLIPALGEKIPNKLFVPLNSIFLVSVILGLSASTGAGILNLSGGLNYLLGIESKPSLWLIVGFSFVSIAVISAITGIMKGIRVLSDLNVKAYFIIAAFLLLTGPLAYVVNIAIEAFGQYLDTFFSQSLFTGTAAGDTWPRGWINYNWAIWLSTIPMAPLFLGRISVGRKVKEYISMNFIIPGCFGILWMSVLSGNSIYQEMTTGSLSTVMAAKGQEFIIYEFFTKYPLSTIVIPFYMIAIFISFVTCVDSNVTAMSSLASTNFTPDHSVSPHGVKIILGGLLLAITWIMLTFANLQGVKILANLGGFPALFIEIIIIVGLVKILKNPEKYNEIDKN
ncbi:BCCT family transporter [Clostridium sediminicola]|uniref:BCCT family transporter n=1 Tax=Clostridium sediminicola TaxID=3114879 RepID=UPI0031F1CB33